MSNDTTIIMVSNMNVDMHSHILPYLDDGAKNWEEFLAIAQKVVAEGITDLVCTPHYIIGEMEFSLEKYYTLLEKAKGILMEQGLRLNLIPGSEVFFVPELMLHLENGKLVTINSQYKYLLIELAALDIPIYLEQVFLELKARGITPIVAHPERSGGFGEEPDFLAKLIKQGALCQLNVGSITGKYGDAVKKRAELFLKSRMIHLLGSDTHNADKGSANYVQGLAEIEKLVGRAKAIELRKINPRQVIRGEELKAYSVDIYKRRSFWFFSKK